MGWAGELYTNLHITLLFHRVRKLCAHTPLAQAECLTTLLASGANHGAAAQDDMNALHFAAQKGHVGACKVLLDKGTLWPVLAYLQRYPEV